MQNKKSLFIIWILVISSLISCKKELEDESHTKINTAETRILGTWELEKVEGDDGVDYTYLFKNDTAENFIYWKFERKRATFASKNDVDLFYFKVKSNYGDKFDYPKYKIPAGKYIKWNKNVDSKGNIYFNQGSWEIDVNGNIYMLGYNDLDTTDIGPFMSNYNCLERLDKLTSASAIKATKITKHKLYLTINKDNLEVPYSVKKLNVIFKR